MTITRDLVELARDLGHRGKLRMILLRTYVIEFENGFRIYDTGDTDVFGDMALIGRRFKPDLALVCIGGHHTMDPEGAAFALREYIRPKQVIPQHYGTQPLINHTPAELKRALAGSPIKVLDMKPGDALRF